MIRTSTIKILLFQLFLLTATLFARGAGGVGVTLISYSLDTNLVTLGYTITISAQVTNFGPVPFNGFINFGLRNQQDTLTNTGIFGQPPYSGDSIQLGGHQTVPAIFSINVNRPYFEPGPNVIVVWPICQAPIADSILIRIIIDTPQGPAGICTLSNTPLTYTLVNNHIVLTGTNPTINVKQVRIYNVEGQKLLEVSYPYITSVPLPTLPYSIYLCQLITADGKITTFKFAAGN